MNIATECIGNETPIGTESGAVEQSGRDKRRKISLWLVDDNVEFRELVAEMFGQEPGFACSRRFASAEAMLAALAREPAPDMVLIDYSMKGMTGAEAVPRIKAMSPLIKVVIMTTFNDSEKRAAAREAGADGFLLKPHDWKANVKFLMDVAVQRPMRTPVVMERDAKRSAVVSKVSSLPPLAWAMGLLKSSWRGLVGASSAGANETPLLKTSRLRL